MKKNRISGQTEKRIRKSGTVLAVCLLFVWQTAFPVLAETVYVNAGNLNYRSAPSMNGAILGTMPRGTKVERERNEGEWSIITVGGVRCYAASRYLTEKPAAAIGAEKHAEPVSADGVQKHADTPWADRVWDVELSGTEIYASYSKIHTGKAVYYHSGSENRKDKTVCVNAGHGTKGGSAVKTLCHPDGTAKVTGGTTDSGATTAVAVSSGMIFADGTAESAVTLKMAKILRDRLLKEGYDVLMIREEDDVQLDNIARTVLANTHADCHIALHWDSTSSDKGCFFMSVPSDKTYRAMEPVASHWKSHNKLGGSLIEGLRAEGNQIFSGGSMGMDLTQTSYSTIPSVDVELGDKASSHSDETLGRLADGLVRGIDTFFTPSFS